MYSQDKINIALQVYHQCGSVTDAIRMLGYPTRRALYTWIESEDILNTLRGMNFLAVSEEGYIPAYTRTE